MKELAQRKFRPSTGAVLSLLLIGLILLSALLYYRAIKIQRYLEPALALAQPRNDFSKHISEVFQKEFGQDPLPGLSLRTGSILMEKSLFFSSEGRLKGSATDHVNKLARVFRVLMDDNHLRSQISLVLIGARFSSVGNRAQDTAERMKAQQLVGAVQDALFTAEPMLQKQYETYFVAAVQPGPLPQGGEDLMEFRIIPSELLHIEVLQKLVKYAF